MLGQSGAMRLRPEFAAAANVAEYEDTTALEPRRTRCAAVVGRIRDFEAAVRGEQGGVAAVALHISAMHDEERDLRAVLRGRFLLLDNEPRRVEHRREV